MPLKEISHLLPSLMLNICCIAYLVVKSSSFLHPIELYILVGFPTVSYIEVKFSSCISKIYILHSSRNLLFSHKQNWEYVHRAENAIY